MECYVIIAIPEVILVCMSCFISMHHLQTTWSVITQGVWKYSLLFYYMPSIRVMKINNKTSVAVYISVYVDKDQAGIRIYDGTHYTCYKWNLLLKSIVDHDPSLFQWD